MINTERELRHAYESVARMDTLRDRLAGNPYGDSQTREDEVESVDAMIRKIERQIAAYLAAHPERTQAPAAQA